MYCIICDNKFFVMHIFYAQLNKVTKTWQTEELKHTNRIMRTMAWFISWGWNSVAKLSEHKVRNHCALGHLWGTWLWCFLFNREGLLFELIWWPFSFTCWRFGYLKLTEMFGLLRKKLMTREERRLYFLSRCPLKHLIISDDSFTGITLHDLLVAIFS